MKRGFLLEAAKDDDDDDDDNEDDNKNERNGRSCSSSSMKSSGLGPLRDARSNRVTFLWGGSAASVKSKPAPWGFSRTLKRGSGSSGSSGSGWSSSSAPSYTPSLEYDLFGNNNHNNNNNNNSSKNNNHNNNNNNSNNSSNSSNSNNNNDKMNPDTTQPNSSSGGLGGPYKNIPLLPHKTLGVPKNALSSWYGKRHKGITITNELFRTWSDGAAPHMLKWTSLFSCPVSNEKFASGRYGDSKFYTLVMMDRHRHDNNVNNNHQQKDHQENGKLLENDNPDPMESSLDDLDHNDDTNNNNNNNDSNHGHGHEIVWYTKKILCEHAAAARAIDCLSMREDVLKGGDGTNAIRLCIEEPYLATDEIARMQVGNSLSKTNKTTNTNNSTIPTSTATVHKTKAPSQQQQQQQPKKRTYNSASDAYYKSRNEYRQARLGPPPHSNSYYNNHNNHNNYNRPHSYVNANANANANNPFDIIPQSQQQPIGYFNAIPPPPINLPPPPPPPPPPLSTNHFYTHTHPHANANANANQHPNPYHSHQPQPHPPVPVPMPVNTHTQSNYNHHHTPPQIQQGTNSGLYNQAQQSPWQSHTNNPFS